MESFWPTSSVRSTGTHYSVSQKLLHRYLSEDESKYNNWKLTDGERTVKLIQAASVDHRLTCREHAGKGREEFGRFTDR